MSYSNFNSPQLAQPQVHKFIPPNKFIEGESFGRMGKPLQPYGTNVVYHATEFVPVKQGLTSQDLKVNYLSYLYNQKTGFDSAHPR